MEYEPSTTKIRITSKKKKNNIPAVIKFWRNLQTQKEIPKLCKSIISTSFLIAY